MLLWKRIVILPSTTSSFFPFDASFYDTKMHTYYHRRWREQSMSHAAQPYRFLASNSSGESALALLLFMFSLTLISYLHLSWPTESSVLLLSYENSSCAYLSYLVLQDKVNSPKLTRLSNMFTSSFYFCSDIYDLCVIGMYSVTEQVQSPAKKVEFTILIILVYNLWVGPVHRLMSFWLSTIKLNCDFIYLTGRRRATSSETVRAATVNRHNSTRASKRY